MYVCCSFTGCAPTVSEIPVQKDCKYVKDGESFDSFLLTECNLDHCTSELGECRDENRLCCCRPLKTEPIDLDCDGTLINGTAIRTNETECGCSVCDDISVTVHILVREPGPEGAKIAMANIIDKKTGDHLGSTLSNGWASFSVPLGYKELSVRVQAANYLPREYMIKLKPTRFGIRFVIALLRRNPISVTPDDLGYTFILSDYVYITISANGFTRNGTVYSGVVMFDGMFMDATEEGFADMIDSDQFILNNTFFSLSYMAQLYFTDIDGFELKAERMDYFVEVSNPDQMIENPFLITFDLETQQWRYLGTLTLLNSVQKRQQGIVLSQLDLPISQFVIQANRANIGCWLQARVFDVNGEPVQGPSVVVTQNGELPDGTRFMYMFGTSTGSAQTRVDQLAENALCLPLACDNFEIATVEGTLQLNRPVDGITPVPFPDDTFNASESGSPTVLGQFFTFTTVVTAQAASDLRPFYDSSETCATAGRLNQQQSDERSYFYFLDENIERPDSDAVCYIKIRIRECISNPNNSVISTSTAQGLMVSVPVGHEDLIDEEFSGNPFDRPDCVESSRVSCTPFSCGTPFQLTVRDDNGIDFCPIEILSPIVQSPLLSRDTRDDILVINADVLSVNDLIDNIDLGMYFDPNPQAALEQCRNPQNLTAEFDNQAAMAGFAASFDCIDEMP